MANGRLVASGGCTAVVLWCSTKKSSFPCIIDMPHHHHNMAECDHTLSIHPSSPCIKMDANYPIGGKVVDQGVALMHYAVVLWCCTTRLVTQSIVDIPHQHNNKAEYSMTLVQPASVSRWAQTFPWEAKWWSLGFNLTPDLICVHMDAANYQESNLYLCWTEEVIQDRNLVTNECWTLNIWGPCCEIMT